MSRSIPTLVDFGASPRYFAGHMDLSRNLRRRILEIGKELTRKQMVAGSDGNISARLDKEQILITPSGLPLGELESDNLVLVDMNGAVLEGDHKPSSELLGHLYLYERRPEISAVVHAHPPYATAFAVAGVELEWQTLPELVVFVGPVVLTPYAAPGTPEVPEALEPYVQKHNAFLLRNHGLITLGRTLAQAWQRHDIVEHAARILYLSRSLGGPKSIPDSELHRLTLLKNALDNGQP